MSEQAFNAQGVSTPKSSAEEVKSLHINAQEVSMPDLSTQAARTEGLSAPESSGSQEAESPHISAQELSAPENSPQDVQSPEISAQMTSMPIIIAPDEGAPYISACNMNTTENSAQPVTMVTRQEPNGLKIQNIVSMINCDKVSVNSMGYKVEKVIGPKGKRPLIKVIKVPNKVLSSQQGCKIQANHLSKEQSVKLNAANMPGAKVINIQPESVILNTSNTPTPKVINLQPILNTAHTPEVINFQPEGVILNTANTPAAKVINLKPYLQTMNKGERLTIQMASASTKILDSKQASTAGKDDHIKERIPILQMLVDAPMKGGEFQQDYMDKNNVNMPIVKVDIAEKNDRSKGKVPGMKMLPDVPVKASEFTQDNMGPGNFLNG